MQNNFRYSKNIDFLNVKGKYNISMSRILKVMWKIQTDIGLGKTVQRFWGCNWTTLAIAGGEISRHRNLLTAKCQISPLFTKTLVTLKFFIQIRHYQCLWIKKGQTNILQYFLIFFRLLFFLLSWVSRRLGIKCTLEHVQV